MATDLQSKTIANFLSNGFYFTINGHWAIIVSTKGNTFLKLLLMYPVCVCMCVCVLGAGEEMGRPGTVTFRKKLIYLLKVPWEWILQWIS